MKQPEHKRSYSITEAAKALGITRSAVHRAIKQRRLEAVESRPLIFEGSVSNLYL
jgi:excisionase family DNA binding protein